MKKIKGSFVSGLFLSVCLLFSASAFAHTLWINAVDYNPPIRPQHRAVTNVYFGWGHHYPASDFLSSEKLKEFSLIYPDGGKERISPQKGGFLATQISFKQEGLYKLTASLKPGFYTMYVERGKIHHKIGPKTGLKGVILKSLYYEQYTKCLINVGKIEDNSFSIPVGHKLEIIPLKNPYLLKTGDFLPLKVLFNGKPVRFCKVYATYMGFSTGDDFAYAASTNSEGIAKIRIIHWGPQLIKTQLMLPAPQSLKDKCNQLSYTATLTFEIP